MTKTVFQPLGYRILVKPSEEPKTVRGIERIRAEAATSGIVVRLGAEVVDGLQVGDRVAFMSYAGMGIEIDGNPHMIISLSEIEAVIDASKITT